MVMEYGYKFRDYAKYALPYDAIALAIIIIFTPLFYSLTI
jgi:di/tricarboxylate transporter